MILILALIFYSIAILLIFKVKLHDFFALFEFRKSKDFKAQISGKENAIENFIEETKDMLKATGQTNRFNAIIVLSVALVAVGAIAGVAIGNYYLIPVFAVACGVIPFIFIRFQFIAYNKLVIEELSTAMSSVTISYERTENILIAFKENIENTREPIKSVFISFVNEIEHINPNYEQALENMKNKVDNSVWVEWCEALKRCSRNRSIKHVLSPIVTKLSKVNIVTGKLQNILSDCIKDFWVMLVAALALLYVGVFVLPSGLMMEIPENLSNILIALNVGVAITIAIKATLITNEIKFDL